MHDFVVEIIFTYSLFRCAAKEITVTTICQHELCVQQSEVFIISGSFRQRLAHACIFYLQAKRLVELDLPYDISHDFANYSLAQNKLLYDWTLLKYRFLSGQWYRYLRHESERRK